MLFCTKSAAEIVLFTLVASSYADKQFILDAKNIDLGTKLKGKSVATDR